MKKIIAIFLTVAMLSSVMAYTFAEECNSAGDEITINKNMEDDTVEAAVEKTATKTATAAPAEPTPKPEHLNVIGMAVAVSNATIYDHKGGSPIGTIAEGNRCAVFKYEGGWTHVSYRNLQGYVKTSNLTPYVAEKAEKTSEKAEQATEKAEQAAEKAEQATEKAEQATEKAEQATEKAEQATEKAEQAAEKTEHASEKTEQATEKVTEEAKIDEVTEKVETPAEQTAMVEETEKTDPAGEQGAEAVEDDLIKFEDDELIEFDDDGLVEFEDDDWGSAEADCFSALDELANETLIESTILNDETEETETEEITAEKTTEEDATEKEETTEEVTTEEVIPEEVTIEEKTAQEVIIEETPAEIIPAEETPIAETPAEEEIIPEEVPADETDEVINEENGEEETASEEIASEGTTSEETPEIAFTFANIDELLPNETPEIAFTFANIDELLPNETPEINFTFADADELLPNVGDVAEETEPETAETAEQDTEDTVENEDNPNGAFLFYYNNEETNASELLGLTDKAEEEIETGATAEIEETAEGDETAEIATEEITDDENAEAVALGQTLIGCNLLDENGQQVGDILSGNDIEILQFGETMTKVRVDGMVGWVLNDMIAVYGDSTTEEHSIRSIRLKSSIDNVPVLELDMVISMYAELNGFENDEYTIQWQYSPDGGASAIDIPGANGEVYRYALTMDNLKYCYRVVVTYESEEI